VKSTALFAALLLPSLGFSATLTATVDDATASVDLANVGTLDWAQWPQSSHEGLISDVRADGWYGGTYGDAGWVVGPGAFFEYTVDATTEERTVYYYFGGWNSESRLTVMLPGARPSTMVSGSSGSYVRVATIRFAANADTVLTVRLEQTSVTGAISMQAAALQRAGSPSAPTPTPPGETPPGESPPGESPTPPATGSALLTWVPPIANTDNTALLDLAGYNVYWGTEPGRYPNAQRVTNPSAVSHTLNGLAAGRWYFVVTAVNAEGRESTYSTSASKLVP
jgi:fibronectin type III domain protein